MSTSSASLRFAVWQWALVVVLGLNLVWTTLCLGGFLAQTMVVTSALTAVMLLVYGLGWLSLATRAGAEDCSRNWPRAPGIVAVGSLFLAFLLYAAMNVHWVTPVRWLGWIDWFGWLQLIAVFWVAANGIRAPAAQRSLFAVLLALGLIAVLLACYQRFVAPDWLMLGRKQVDQYAGRVSGPFGIPNSLAAFLLLLLPATGALTVRRRSGAPARVFFGWMMLVLLFGVYLTISRGGWLALAVALTAWPLLVPGVKLRRRLVRAGSVALSVAVMGVGAYAASPRVQERVAHFVREAGERSRPILWRAAGHIVREHPVFGSGGGSFDVMFERYRPEGFLNEPFWAHNDYLNTLSDYGAVGFVLFFGAAGVVIWRCWRGKPWDRTDEASPNHRPDVPRVLPETGGAARRPASVGDSFDEPVVRQALAIGLMAFALQLFVDFHFKIPALAMAFATLAGILVARTWPDPVKRAPSAGVRWISGAVLLGLAVTIVIWFVPLFRAEAVRQSARRRIDRLVGVASDTPLFREQLTLAKGELDAAVELAPSDAQAWADRAYVDAQQSLVEPQRAVALGIAAEADASQAIALTSLNAEYWVRRGVARDLQGKWMEAGDDFTRAILLSPKAVLPWFHYAYHLSLHPNSVGLAQALVDFCLRLDPANRDAVRLRQQLATGRTGP